MQSIESSQKLLSIPYCLYALIGAYFQSVHVIAVYKYLFMIHSTSQMCFLMEKVTHEPIRGSLTTQKIFIQNLGSLFVSTLAKIQPGEIIIFSIHNSSVSWLILYFHLFYSNCFSYSSICFLVYLLNRKTYLLSLSIKTKCVLLVIFQFQAF